MARQRIKVTRRSALLVLGCSALVALLGRFTRVAFSFLEPPRTANSFGGVFEVGAVRELPEAGSPPLLNGAGRFWLVHDERGLRAVHSSCTHLHCLFSWDQEKETFVCPCHGSQFSRAGTVLKGPATRDLDAFPVLLVDQDGRVAAQTDPESAAPLSLLEFLSKPAEDEVVNSEEMGGPGAPIRVMVDTGRKLAGARRPGLS